MVLYAAGPFARNVVAEIFEQTLSAIPSIGSKPKSRYDICAGLADVRALRPDLAQNYTTFMFPFPSARDSRDRHIHGVATGLTASLLVQELRKKYGCFYSPEAGGWNSNASTSINYLSMSNTPKDSTVACHGILEFYRNIDHILTDDIIIARLEDDKFALSDLDFVGVGILGRVRVLHKDFSEMFDAEKALKMVDTIRPGEIRQKAREIISAIQGIYVQGPEPERVPSLEFMQQAIAAMNHGARMRLPLKDIPFNIGLP